MNLGKSIKSLCSPAYFYLVVSVIVIALLVVQNVLSGKPNELCIGAYSCDVPNILLVLLLKVLYVAFWTVILDSLCKYGLKRLSWFLVLLPFVLVSIAFGLAVMGKEI